MSVSGKAIVRARAIRHQWHSDGMNDSAALEEIDELLGTHFYDLEDEIIDRLTRDSYQRYIDTHSEICDEKPCQTCEDIEKLSESEFVKKYYDEIEDDALEFDKDFRGRSNCLEELNSAIRRHLNYLLSQLPDTDPTKKEIEEEKKRWREYKAELEWERAIERGEIDFDDE